MLRRLEVRGFKSFAMHATLDLGPGVNVIVGPNGSGKSNLAEAIVWAMGEQRASRIRAAGMGEVVFSGGEGRQPAGLAEVSMTLTQEALGADRAAETQVSRRVTRAGDAAYRLNGVGCRLLDIHEELATIGLGPDALAVIRQGQVEAVCASRPGELRAVIEEAAGVALQKRRRRRAESKLNRVAERLDRARDLAVELEARRAQLSRQATQAVRAAEMETQIEAGRVRLAAVSAAAAARALAAARGRLAETATGVTAADAELAEARRVLDEANLGVAEAEAAREASLELARGLRSAGERLSGRAELAEERILQSRRSMDRDRAEREAAVAARDDAQWAASETAERAALAETAVREAEERLATARETHRAHAEAAREARRQADDARHASDEAQRA
ncbi:MAG: AAA family ATPase, partial [Thermoleophilia bacterium]|nr:AAA family ATPase [Thermoleophilia bacterium]